MRLSGAFTALVLLMWNSSAVYGQPSITGTSRTVLAAVVAPDGRPVVDLDIDDFVVTEGGATREVLDVHVADYPVALILDDRASGAQAIASIKRAAVRFVERIGDRPVALVRLSAQGGVAAPLDTSRADLVGRVEALQPTQDPARPLDAVSAAAALLRDATARFSCIVIVAAGVVDASTPVRGELLPRILESGATVHVVQAADAAADTVAGDLLKALSQQTRGQFTAIYSTASYDTALDRLADRLSMEMMVEYLVPEAPRGGDVQVGVRKPGARVVGLGVR